ncbi:hypothetical protein T09_10237 [Trichinella sp. T9]|nr:hypothetical protein T09_10237 [Trichinella sp. T9]
MIFLFIFHESSPFVEYLFFIVSYTIIICKRSFPNANNQQLKKKLNVAYLFIINQMHSIILFDESNRQL